MKIGRILHPSPASPAANLGWAEAATAELRALGIDVPDPKDRSVVVAPEKVAARARVSPARG